MSELINTQNRGKDLRWHLLLTVSSLALIAAVESQDAKASDHPSVWIELGGQLERIDGKEDPDLPPFMAGPATAGPFSVASPYDAQKPSIYSYGAEGKINVQPNGTPWHFSAAIRYGRSNNNKHIHQQSQVSIYYLHRAISNPPYRTRTGQQFADFRVKNTESHVVLDFQAGRDVGLGWLSSVASFGVRVAQFVTSSNVKSIARPEVGFNLRNGLGPGKYYEVPHHTDFTSVTENQRSFHGIGPSSSWEGNIPVLHGEDRAVTFDWGINGAVLFGRQKARGTHQTTARYYSSFSYQGAAPYGVVMRYQHPALPHNRTRSVVVPNIGGLAGLSFRYAAAKVSLGYRADFFFNAMDTGIDTRDTANRNFYGPFVTIGIGLGG